LGVRILQGAGYQVIAAENGRQGLDLYKKERGSISLVILDLIMPEMGGRQCLDELLKIDPGVKILVATGYSPNFGSGEEIGAGSRLLVAKPFSKQQLLQAVREVLNGAELQFKTA